ncbi:MAG: glycoside hydrolase family 38 C-terminal domain-containing protein [bacterium]
MKFYSYCQTHWDREWYQPFEEFRLRLITVFEEIIGELTSGNMDSFYFDGQTVALEDYFEIKPEQKEAIKQLISEKKLYVGPWYALADEFLVSGESLLRNLIIGIKQARKLGCSQFVGYLPDTFGHVAYIPMLLNSVNIDSAVVWRGTGNLKSEFKWKSKDGAEVLALNLIEGYFIDVLNAKIPLNKKVQLLKSLLKKIKKMSVSDIALFPLGGDHLGAVKDLKVQLEKINPRLKSYKVLQSNLFEYIELIKNKKLTLKRFFSELRDNSRSNTLPGVYSTRLYLKKNNVVSEWKLRKQAEPICSFLQFTDSIPERDQELEYAWKMLIKNHPHDSICGCSTDAVHREMLARYEKINQISDGLLNRGLYELAKSASAIQTVIFNSSNYNYSGVVEIETDEKLENDNIQFIEENKKFPIEILLDTSRPPYREDIKSYYKSLIYIDNLAAGSIKTVNPLKLKELEQNKIKLTENYIDNEILRVEINHDGSLNLTDIKTGKAYNNLHVLCDRADIGDTYNYCPIKDDDDIVAQYLGATIIEKGILRSTLQLLYSMQIPESSDFDTKTRSTNLVEHKFTVDISLKYHSSLAEFNVNFENKSKNHLLQLKFNTGDKIYSTISEDGFGVVNREFNPDYNIEDFMPAQRPDELKTNTAPKQRFVSANGLAIISEGLSEYEVFGSELKLTLLRSVGILSQGPMDTRSVAAGPPIAVPEAQCVGFNSYRYALCFAEKPKELFKQADVFMGSVVSMQGKGLKQASKTQFKLLSTDNDAVYIYAIKSAMEKGIVVRVYNQSSRKQSFKFKSDLAITFINEVNSLEEEVSEKIYFNNKLEIPPFNLKTFLLR